MSVFNNPNFISFSGEPITGRMPTKTVVYGPQMTGPQQAGVAHAYKLFCDAVNTSVGKYVVQNRVLADGTKVRMISNWGNDTVMVWASDAQSEGSWDMGWSFIPANDNSLNGFLRRPGAAPGDLSAAAFLPLGNHGSPAGKAVHTFVGATTGNRRLCTDREGGSRMWRGGKNMPVLSYDSDVVWVDGVKSVLRPLAPQRYAIMGAAIAKRDGVEWLVFVVFWRLWAVRLRELKAQTNNCVDCGPITNGWGWEFSPDGMNAISLGESSKYWGDGSTLREAICRIKLVPENGTAPFRPEVSEQLHGEAIRKRVINTFHFNQAKRNFRFLGWKDFMIRADDTYYGAIRFDIDSGWGPVLDDPLKPPSSLPESERSAGDFFRMTGPYFDVRMTALPVSGTSGLPERHTDPTNFTKDTIDVRIPRSDFLFDDGYGPEEIAFTRRFLAAGPNDTHLVTWPAGYFPHLGGWLLEGSPTNMYFRHTVYQRWEPHEREILAEMSFKRAERLTISSVSHKKRFTSPSFPSLSELATFCDGRWSAAQSGTDQDSVSHQLYDYYGPLAAKNDYTSYVGLFEHLAGLRWDMQIPSKNARDYIRREVILDSQGPSTTIHEVGQEPPTTLLPIIVEKEFTEALPDGTPHTFTAMVERTSYGLWHKRAESFRMNGAVTATPVYTNNWTTDWVLESQVFLSGKAYIAAGYDAKGRERFLYMEGDDSQRLRYESSAKADNEPVVQLAWNFSGALGYRLMLDEEVIDSCTYAVADGVTLPDRGYSGGENAVGPSPTIRAGQIAVCDFDIALGHVLYRKSEEVFTKEEGQSGNRKNALRLSYRDFLKTSKDKHQLGEERVFTSAQREVDYLIAESLATASLFYETAPCFSTKPDTIVLNGVHIVPYPTAIGGGANPFPNDFASLVPQAQRNERGRLSGEVEERWSAYWLTKMMLYTPGVDNEICRITEKALFWNDGVSSGAPRIGRFTKPPQSHMVLRAYSDDCWLVCYQVEKHIQDINTDNTTARYFLKLAKGKPVQEFDAAAHFQYLGSSKKLLAPKFHIRKKT